VLVRINGVEWLIKFKATSDPEDVGTIEYNYSLIAKKCGIVMPETRLFEGKYFGVQRFDRQAEKRIHVHSAAGLLYASHRLPSLDYTALLKATMALTRDFAEVEKVFRQMVFNVLIGNKDDHSKNFSFIYHNNSWKLSPAYDLLPSFGFNNNHTTTINGKGKPTIEDCIEVAKLTAFPVKSAERIIEEVKENVY
jgi:serine/threonine-protein kinase HipA